jgi:hypothetical protein
MSVSWVTGGCLLDSTAFSAAAVLERLPLLKYHNARGSHIYIRPSGEHRFTVLDDLSESSLEKLSADGLNPLQRRIISIMLSDL